MFYISDKAGGSWFSHLGLILWDQAAEEFERLTTTLLFMWC